jgi:hypothetical protein
MTLTLPKWGLRSLPGLPRIHNLISGGQNTSPWGVLYTIEKVLKCRCRKWPRMGHSNICSTSYVWKKGRESLKVGNRPDPGVCRRSATHCWKALKDSYKFASDLILIRGLNKELWAAKVSKVQTGTVSGLPLGSPGTKGHLDVALVEWHKVCYMGEGGGFPWVRIVVSQVSPKLPVVCPSTKGVPKCELTNLLVGLMQVWVSE